MSDLPAGTPFKVRQVVYDAELEARRAARVAWIEDAAARARVAIEWNAETRAQMAAVEAAAATLQAAAASMPATRDASGTAAQQLDWVYARLREVASAAGDIAGGVALVAERVGGLTVECDGLIDLFAAVIPTLDDIID